MMSIALVEQADNARPTTTIVRAIILLIAAPSRNAHYPRAGCRLPGCGPVAHQPE
jgi:hypothetical protein